MCFACRVHAETYCTIVSFNRIVRFMDERPAIGYYVKTPAVSLRERIVVKCVAIAVALVVHFFAFYAVGLYIDAMRASFDVDIAWSTEPLTGFGMMQDWDEDGEGLPEAPAVDANDDPFDEDLTPIADEPSFDTDSIEVDEPEREEEVDERPEYDLTRDKKKLEATRRDLASMPKLKGLAPGNAKLIVLIRNDRVAGSRFEDSVRRLYRAFPDYRFALGSSEIDPVNEVRAMLIATAKPKLYAETFLAVAHDIPEESLKKTITQSFPTRIIWSTFRERPLATPDIDDGRYSRSSGLYKRVLYLADPHMVLFLRPEVLPSLQNSPVLDIVKTRDEDLEKSPDGAQTFLQALGGIAESDSVSAPTLFFMLQGIEGIRLGRGFPDFVPPKAVTASLSTAAQPHLNLEAIFSSPENAKNFVSLWPEIVSAASSFGVPGTSVLLNALSLTDEGESVIATGDLNGAMISLVLMFAANYLERNSN